MGRNEQRPADWLTDFERAGFAMIPDVIGIAEVAALVSALEKAGGDIPSVRRAGGSYAMRNLAERMPAVKALTTTPRVQSIAAGVLGTKAFLVRGLLFDKIPGANWKVAWHQDLSIAVRQRKETAGFGPWSVKAGVQHVQPPVPVLERMLTVRLHLDDCDEDNGPLRVIPGSHLAGRMDADAIQAWRARVPDVKCAASRGDVLLMRPLLLHASSAARTPRHRRVIHFEFASENLPGGLEWLIDCAQ